MAAGETSSTRVRERLDHPVIDIDGHTTEYLPALAPYLKEEGVDPSGTAFNQILPGYFGPVVDWYSLTPEERFSRRVSRPPFWGAPAVNTKDLATALFPKLMYERLDEFGIDFGVIFPSLGLVLMHLQEEQARRGTVRALNRYNADTFAPFSDRMTPVAAIPMYTPEEAIDELEHAVVRLGFKAVLLAGYVQRPVPAFEGRDPELEQYGMWIDMYGIDSAYDYDPVWAKCQELGVSVSFHSGSIGWGSRVSISNYMYNHLGHLAEGNHSLAKALFMGGVTRRFPSLNFAFLEGGSGWGSMLYADIVGHWVKRNRKAMEHINPANVDQALFAELAAKYGPAVPASNEKRFAARLDESQLDEWAACGIEKAEDIKTLFADRFFFGCEADDPMTAVAFNSKLNPFGAKLHAMFGSDISHWDVPDMTEVLEEAWEMVEHEYIDQADFKEFVFGNPVRMFAGTNPAFFKGTAVEADVDRFLAES
jgi:predicted TIM-barrel fold metal-dependent hydrolase